jgi:hypothetical protein
MIEWLRLGAVSLVISTLLTAAIFLPFLLLANRVALARWRAALGTGGFRCAEHAINRNL